MPFRTQLYILEVLLLFLTQQAEPTDPALSEQKKQ